MLCKRTSWPFAWKTSIAESSPAVNGLLAEAHDAALRGVSAAAAATASAAAAAALLCGLLLLLAGRRCEGLPAPFGAAAA